MAKQVKLRQAVAAFKQEVDTRTKAVVFYSLLNINIKANLRRSLAQTVFEARRRRVVTRYFAEWFSLYAYYRRFTSSQNAGYVALKMSDSQFLSKFWLRLKAYTRRNRVKSRKQRAADEFFFRRWARICFDNWRFFSVVTCKAARLAGQRVSKKHLRLQKALYFRALRRAFLLSKEASLYRDKSLKGKVFISFLRKKQFDLLKAQIRTISASKHNEHLLTKAFDSLALFTARKLKLRHLLALYSHNKSSRLQQHCFEFLKHWRLRSQQKKRARAEIRHGYEGRVLAKALRELCAFALRRKMHSRIQAVVRAKHAQKVTRHFLLCMLIEFNKRQLTRQIREEIAGNREYRLTKFAFARWVYRFRYLTQACKHFSDRRTQTTKSEIWALWRFKFVQRKAIRYRHTKLVGRIARRTLREALKGWIDYLQLRAQRRRLVKLGQCMVLKNRLTLCCDILRYHAFLKKQNRKQTKLANLKL